MTVAAVAAGVSAAAAVAGVAVSASNSKSAAGAQTKANNKAFAEGETAKAINTAAVTQAQDAYVQSGRAAQSYLAPYAATGANANDLLNKDLGYLNSGYTPQDYRQDPGYTPMVNTLAELQATPGYQFQLEQGLQGVNNSATARGSVLSGQTLKAITDYGQGLASTSFQDAWQRAQTAYQNAFARDNTQKNAIAQRIGGIAGQGQGAATAMGGIAMNVAQGASTAGLQGAGNAINLATGQAATAQNQGAIDYNQAANQNASMQQGLKGLSTAANYYAPTLGSYLSQGTNQPGQNNAATYFGANNAATIPQYNWG